MFITTQYKAPVLLYFRTWTKIWSITLLSGMWYYHPYKNLAWFDDRPILVYIGLVEISFCVTARLPNFFLKCAWYSPCVRESHKAWDRLLMTPLYKMHRKNGHQTTDKGRRAEGELKQGCGSVAGAKSMCRNCWKKNFAGFSACVNSAEVRWRHTVDPRAGTLAQPEATETEMEKRESKGLGQAGWVTFL